MSGNYRGLRTLFAITLLWLLAATPLFAGDLTLAVANSTCSAINTSNARFMEEHPVKVSTICKSSGRLAKGLSGGAISADIYVSANKRWMDYMIEKKLIDATQVVSPWRNQLVVAARSDQKMTLASWEALADDQVKTILIGDPGTAPFGRYAKQALQSTGLWGRVRHKIETRKHITLLAQSLEQAPPGTVGILFATNLTPNLETIHQINAEWHDPIRYFMAPLSGSTSDVETMMDYLQSEVAQGVFRHMGFGINRQ